MAENVFMLFPSSSYNPDKQNFKATEGKLHRRLRLKLQTMKAS